jgi:5-methyltetrahydrofolate--homocysteine methyltransferase
MGTQIQAANLTADDFAGLDGCNEILNVTRPDVIQGIHTAYFNAGADMVQTNTFGAIDYVLADYQIGNRL